MIFTDELVPIECANCHMNFGVTKAFQQARLKDHKGFTCPNGHSNVYSGQSEEEKLRQERDRLKQQLAYKDDRIASEQRAKEHAQRSATTYKGHLTRTKRRIGKGTCPCCNRHFSNVERHMATKHREYSESEAA